MKKQHKVLITFCILLSAACSKYLDKKPDQQQVIPETIEDLQALLDNNSVMNNSGPSAGESSSDNYFVSDKTYDNFYLESSRSLYTWGNDITYSDFPNDWSRTYDPVYFANTVLENIGKLSTSDVNERSNVEGQAYFFRGYYFLKALSDWALAYDSATASTDLGIPLRLSSDFNQKSLRASVQESYNQVISDLRQATLLLPANQITLMRPTKFAAQALMSRCYLNMRAYQQAFVYSDSVLQAKNALLNYNTLNAASFAPVPRFNEEVIVSMGMSVSANIYYGHIDTALYNSFESDDLRKQIFFYKRTRNTVGFKGNYFNSGPYFTGPAIDEMYLIRAEAEARLNNLTDALNDINYLLMYRYKTGTFIPYTNSNQQQVLELILRERRKELIYRDLRWIDLKRLNKETGNEVELKRMIDGMDYILPPNDLRYALPIPTDVLKLSGMQQNPR